MLTRKANVWDVVIQSETGQTLERKFRAFWDPTKENVTSESIATAAAAMEFVATGKKARFVGISAQLATE